MEPAASLLQHLTLRKLRAGDHGYVIAYFARTTRESPAPNESRRQGKRRGASNACALLASPLAHWAMLTDEKDKGRLFGFAVGQEGTLHFVAVATTMRGIGLCRNLLIPALGKLTGYSATSKRTNWPWLTTLEFRPNSLPYVAKCWRDAAKRPRSTSSSESPASVATSTPAS